MVMGSFFIICGSFAVFLILVGFTIAKLYKRATRETALVKTGAGGKSVIIDGGAIIIPLLHECSPINMKTLRLEVRRTGDGALITKDRMWVVVGVEFYVSENATEEGIARAAQTLGDRTFFVDQLREMIDGKLVDGLRSVAARMAIDELHENRSDFVQEVQNAVSSDLLKNGLELESVLLTALDQTPFEALDENNAFNAVGMRKLAEVIAQSKKERAEIEAQADVAVRRSAMEAERLRLNIEKEEEQARSAQIQELCSLEAGQEAEIARKQEAALKEREIARVSREQNIRAAEITKSRELEVAEQERQIVIAQKSEEESRARASADSARAEAIKAAESVQTARDIAVAEREKHIALIEASKEAEREATQIRLAATAEKDAAADRAAAKREKAQADADAIIVTSEAKKLDLLAEAEGRRALVEADNVLSSRVVDMKVNLAKLEALPAIIAEMVKPAQKIDSIKIHQVTGLTGGNFGNGIPAADKPLVNQALDSIMGMAVQLPALKKLGDELGLSREDGVSGILKDIGKLNGAAKDADEVTEN